jgi:hypothetical protein
LPTEEVFSLMLQKSRQELLEQFSDRSWYQVRLFMSAKRKYHD